MSNFYCEKCGVACTEDQSGHYVTGCEHYPPDILSDGYGSQWANFCQKCQSMKMLEVVRPGKVQCSNCGN